MSVLMDLMQDYIEIQSRRVIKHNEDGQKSIILISDQAANPHHICYLTAVIVPIICTFGICGNIMSISFLAKYEKRCSYFTYLIVLSFANLGNCILMVISALAGQLQNTLIGIDDLIAIPLSALFSGISISSTVAVTLDRLFILWQPVRVTNPSYCTKVVARRVIAISIITSFVLSLPYYFIYTVDEKGVVLTTNFFYSRWYCTYNWVRFFLYGVIPAIILCVCTALLILSLKRVSLQLRHLSCKSKNENVDSHLQTLTLILIVVFFLIGEVPGNFLSKRSAVVMLFGGDDNEISNSTFQMARKIAAVLCAINLSSNFLLYFIFRPLFRDGIKHMFCWCKNEEKMKDLNKVCKEDDVKIEVFIVSDNLDDFKLKDRVARLSKMFYFSMFNNLL